VRWLMIGLLVSVVGLLTAAIGMARHIWVRRSQERRNLGRHAEQEAERAEEAESEVEL
jgi:cytochrome c biogenesis protein ResB